MPGPENTPTTPEHDVPAGAVRELSTGAVIAVLFAEAMSSVRLFGLGERVGFAWYLAWLLPGALDVYALTMLRFSSRIPDGHRLRRKAMHEAILALAITVGCNALYETVTAFATQLPAWAPGTLFVLVSALAPFVAGRIIHFHAGIGRSAAVPVAAALPQESPAVPQIDEAAALALAAADDAALDDAALPQQTMPQEFAAADTAALDAAPQKAPAAVLAPQQPAALTALAAAAPEPLLQQAEEVDDEAEDDAPPPANGAARPIPNDERLTRVIEIIARNGGRDNVSGTTIGDALGKSRDTGIRALRAVDKLPDLTWRIEQARQRLNEAGESSAEDTESAEDPERELVLA